MPTGPQAEVGLADPTGSSLEGQLASCPLPQFPRASPLPCACWALLPGQPMALCVTSPAGGWSGGQLGWGMDTLPSPLKGPGPQSRAAHRGEEVRELCPRPWASCLTAHRALKAWALGHQRPREAHGIELSVNEPEACGLHFPQLCLLQGHGWEGRELPSLHCCPMSLGGSGKPGWGIIKKTPQGGPLL